MKALIVLLFVVGSVGAAEVLRNPGGDQYEADQKMEILKVIWSDGSIIIKDVIGDKGEITRDLESFDGKKALHYENLASRSQFEVYITLERVGNELVIDCIYGNIRSEQNGALINKAVCGLGKKLGADYEQLIYKYSNSWKNEAALANMSPLMQEFPSEASVTEGIIKDIKILKTYQSQNDWSFNLPATVIERNDHSHNLGRVIVFSVYDKSDLAAPVRIEVTSKTLEAPFERLDYEKLENLLK